MQRVERKYIRSDKVGFLFFICFFAYFSTYIGRNSFSAVLAQILESEGFAKSTLGLVSTGFFVCYGAGQLVSGAVGDHVPPQWMVFIGVLGSAVINCIMAFMSSPAVMLPVWCVNGVFQSMTWSPILRIVSEHMPPKQRHDACVKLAYTYPAGVLVTYGVVALLLKVFDWQSAFLFASLTMVVAALTWILGIRHAETFYETTDEVVEVKSDAAKPAAPGKVNLLAFLPLLGLLSGALIVQGALRDGIMNWVPTSLNSTFSLGVSFSTFCTMALPVLNLVGVEVANQLIRRFHMTEMQGSLILFCVASVSALVITLLPGSSFIITLICFALLTACMTGINMILVSLVPTYFLKWNRVAFISGLLNSMVYVGSSIATYGLGALADSMGWGSLFAILCGMAVLGAVVTAGTLPLWKKFTQKVQ